MRLPKTWFVFLFFAIVSHAALAITNPELFTWAAAAYPAYFHGTPSSGQYQQYDYRHYPSGNYLAVDDAGGVFVLGPVSGNVILPVGTLAGFAPSVQAWQAAQPRGRVLIEAWNPDGTKAGAGAEIALELMRREITKKARVFNFATVGPQAEHVMVTILMSPSIARALADAGHTKQSIRDYLYENARIRLDEFEWLTAYTYPAALTVRQKVDQSILPPEFLGPPDKMVRVLSGPEIVHIVVCGDPNRNRLMVLEGGHTEPTTKEIRRVAAR